jgi:hypothetical protein
MSSYASPLGLSLLVLGTLATLPAPARAGTGLGALVAAAHVNATNANESAAKAVSHQRAIVDALTNTLGPSTALTSESKHLAYYEKQRKALAELEKQIDELERRIEESACE